MSFLDGIWGMIDRLFDATVAPPAQAPPAPSTRKGVRRHHFGNRFEPGQDGPVKPARCWYCGLPVEWRVCSDGQRRDRYLVAGEWVNKAPKCSGIRPTR